jgi:hypothetical protein
MKVEPYLFFNGRCEEALEFYRRALGAEVTTLMRMKDSPEPHPPGMCPPGWENNVMHANLRIGETQVMASDGMPGSKPDFTDDRRARRSQGPAGIRCPGRRRTGADAARQDFLFAVLRHGCGSLRRFVDGDRAGVKEPRALTEPSAAPMSPSGRGPSMPDATIPR